MQADSARHCQSARLIPSARDRSLPLYLKLTALFFSAGIGYGLIKQPISMVITAACLVCALSVLMAVLRCAALLYPLPAPAPPGKPEGLPIISVLLPLYREARMVAPLLSHIRQTHYPKDKLDIIIVCEPDDPDTIRAAASETNHNTRLFVAPEGGPQTKPKALNAALPYTRGSIITVYDAEDRPHPDQLHHAANALTIDPRMAVVQAPLIYYNAEENSLTRQFALEYAALFMVWLPFLARFNLPFPLGGTSNHIRKSALQAVSGWDSYNVTEDADIGFRLAAADYKMGWISPPTGEEAVNRYTPWQKQRSRWMKGYMQTWLTHMKRPFLPGGRTGLIRHILLQLTVGVTLIAGFFHVPFMISSLAMLTYGMMTGAGLPDHAALFAGTLSTSYLAGLLIGAVGAWRVQRPHLIPSAILMPLYWLLLFLPTLQALIEMFTRPFYWHKTEHGVTGAPDIKPDETKDRHVTGFGLYTDRARRVRRPRELRLHQTLQENQRVESAGHPVDHHQLGLPGDRLHAAGSPRQSDGI